MTKGERRIRQAFLDLLEEKGFYQIRVGEIVKLADVSRATFYSNFEDKYQLIRILRKELFDGFGDVMNNVRQSGYHGITDRSIKYVFVQYFQYVRETYRIWKIFFDGKGENDFSDQLARSFYNWLMETQAQWATFDPDMPDEHSAVICSWAYVALFSYWVKTGMQESEERMAETLAVFWSRFIGWDA